MNVDLISHEAHVLLGEIASYEEPRISFEPMDTLAELAKQFNRVDSVPREVRKASPISKGHVTDIAQSDTRQSAILDIVRSKGTVYIKDISMVIRDVSEKTIQRALSKLVGEGILEKRGERRWTAYSLAK
jgi:DNA-binding transcriptional ArsR family regulator